MKTLILLFLIVGLVSCGKSFESKVIEAKYKQDLAYAKRKNTLTEAIK